jgi:hypothetical protein
MRPRPEAAADLTTDYRLLAVSTVSPWKFPELSSQ